MVEGDRQGLSYNECRRDLRLHEQRWRELRWRKMIDLTLPDLASQYSQITLVGRTLYVFDGNQHCHFQRAARVVLPTVEDEAEAHWQPIWEELEFGCTVYQVLMDVSQDLLVLVEYMWGQ